LMCGVKNINYSVGKYAVLLKINKIRLF